MVYTFSRYHCTVFLKFWIAIRKFVNFSAAGCNCLFLEKSGGHVRLDTALGVLRDVFYSSI